MRTLAEIRDSIRIFFVENTTLQTLYGLNPTLSFAEQFSAVSLEAAFVDVAAFVTYTLERVFDAHKTEVSDMLAQQKPHGLRWYRNKAVQFRLGQPLIADTDEYSDAGLTEAQIAATKIIKYAAAVEVNDNSGVPLVRIKVAGASGNNLQPLTLPQITAANAYMQEVKDAGVKLRVTSDPPDFYKAALEIYYNPLVCFSLESQIIRRIVSDFVIKRAIEHEAQK